MSVVDVRVDGARADVTLRRPDVLNAMNWDVFDGLVAATESIAGRGDVRVVVVSGEGRSFSSGIDTAALMQPPGGPEEMIARAQAGFRRLIALPVPTIAAVTGHALGAGMQLALACDLRVVARDASLGVLEARFGLVPDLGGTHRLPALVGAGMAKKLTWLAETFDGEAAHRMGLAEVVIDASELDDAVDDLVARIAAAPPMAIREVKRLIELGPRLDAQAAMDEEARAQTKIFGSADFAEALSAFAQKREPITRGHRPSPGRLGETSC